MESRTDNQMNNQMGNQPQMEGRGEDRSQMEERAVDQSRMEERAADQSRMEGRGVDPVGSHARKKPGKVGNFFFGLLVIIVMIVIQVAVGMFGMFLIMFKIALEHGNNPAEINARYMEYVQTSGVMTYLELAAVALCLVVAAVWYYFGYVRKDKKAGIYESVWPKLKDPKVILFLLLGTVSCSAIASVLDVLMEFLLPEYAERLQKTLEMTLTDNIALGVISAVILAPICEEVAVRGIILRQSKKVHGVVGCMILSAVLFSLFHMNLIQGVYVIPMGLFWAYVDYKFDSVVPSIFCHAVNNLLGMFVIDCIMRLVGIWASIGIFVVFGLLAVLLGSRIEILHRGKTSEEPGRSCEAK